MDIRSSAQQAQVGVAPCQGSQPVGRLAVQPIGTFAQGGKLAHEIHFRQQSPQAPTPAP